MDHFSLMQCPSKICLLTWMASIGGLPEYLCGSNASDSITYKTGTCEGNHYGGGGGEILEMRMFRFIGI